MKTIGIIAEFNPFHYGHEYLIAEAKRLMQADFCIVVLSGNFVQRGTAALMDKYTRAKMALLNGVDLVVELPVVYATGSAEYFARGAVRLLDKMGVVDYLCFGSECGDITLLKLAAELLATEDSAFQKRLQECLKKGMSFPLARSQSIDSIGQSMISEAPLRDSLHEIINQPNNILGLEYIKALDFFNSKITPATIKRKGAGYHEEVFTPGKFCSATAIRKMLKDVAVGQKEATYASLHSFVPENTLSFYKDPSLLALPSDISKLLYYKLTLEAERGYTQFFDVSNDISDKIKKNLPKYTTDDDFIHLLKSKDLTYMRISRCLCHILLDIYAADIGLYTEHDYIFYARMLGFREDAHHLLKEIKTHSSIPLLSKLADAKHLLSETGMKMLKKDIQAAHIYNHQMNEYTVPIEKVL